MGCFITGSTYESSQNDFSSSLGHKFCYANAGWQIRQVKINHVQVGNANYFYITVAGASGCANMTGGKGWLSFGLNEMNERKKMLMSLALTIQVSGQPVDVGSTISGCNSVGTADLQFIRLGDWSK